MLISTPSVQSPRAYDLRHLQGGQLAARMSAAQILARMTGDEVAQHMSETEILARLTANGVGHLKRPTSAEETAATVTVYNHAYNYDSAERYGAVDLTGAVDSSTAINTALLVRGCVDVPAGDILWDTAPTLGAHEHLIVRGVSPKLTKLHVGNQTGNTFLLSNAVAVGQVIMLNLTVDGANGGDAVADASATWEGFLKITKTTGVGVYRTLMVNVEIRSSAVDGAAMIDIGTGYNVRLQNVKLGNALDGYSLKAGGAFGGTTITLDDCYLHFSRQGYLVTAGVTDITFNNTKIESNRVAGHSTLAQITFNGCYFENIGYDILSLGRDGKSMMSGGISWGNALDSTECDAAFTQVYGRLTFNDCRWSNAHADLSAWVHPIGLGSGNGAEGVVEFNGGSNTDTIKTMFRSEVVGGERGDYVLMAWDGVRSVLGSIGVIRHYSDQRLLTRGLVKVIFPATVRLAEVHRGRFHYGCGTETYAAWLADAPTGGQNEVGDRVQVTAPAAAGFMGYVCTTAGSPGTGKGYGAIAP